MRAGTKECKTEKPFEFSTQLVDDINDEVNGKFRSYRSLVESDYGV